MCPFCDHRNPAGARFCNECASPLHLKPCNQCDGVNDRAAINCYSCGAAYPASSNTSEVTHVLPSTDLAPARAAPGDVAVTATVTQSPFVRPARRAYRGLLRPGPFLIAALATILIAGAYTAHYIKAVTPDAMEVAWEPMDAAEHSAPAEAPTVALPVDPQPSESETVALSQVPVPPVNSDAPKPSSERQRTVPAAKRASAHQRPAPQRGTPVGATLRGARRPPAAPVGVPIAEISKKPTPDRWQAMQVTLKRCSGDLIARIVCDQRVRRQFCEGHWGHAPACVSGVVNDHGQ